MSEDANLELRIREVEKLGTIVQTNLGNMCQDITEMKQMFQKMAAETLKITELATKIQAIERLEKKHDYLAREINLLQQEFVVIKAKHEGCQLVRGEEGATLKDLFNKMTAIEASYQKLESTLDSLKQSRGRLENIAWVWLERAGWLLMIGLVWLLFSHKGPEKNKNTQENLNQPTAITETTEKGE